MTITAPNSLPAGVVGTAYDVALSVTNGTAPHRWELAAGSLPEGLTLDRTAGVIKGQPTRAGTAQFTVQVTGQDQAQSQTAEFLIMISGTPEKSRFGGITRMTTWLAVIALAAPVLGYASIVGYVFATPGARWAHLAAGTLTALAAFLAGSLIGFILATPRVVSSGQLKGAGVSLGSNLAEVSDWLTKLLLGAGLVDLTHLGGPIASLIDRVAIGLQNPAAGGGAGLDAKVMAGLIILGYTVLGLLESYVVTSVWYPKKLAALADAVEQLPTDARHSHTQ
ncbi:MAG: Ig domain-containing protein [Streptosporangiaceae bacterium]